MITLTEGDDVFTLELTQDEIIDALGGDDEITIIGGPEFWEGPEPAFFHVAVNGGTGDDKVELEGMFRSINFDGGAGDDNLYIAESSGGFPTHNGGIAHGGDGNDRIVGGWLDEIHGGAGDDYLDGTTSDMWGAYVDGGDGNDILRGDGVGGAGSDIMYGSWEVDGGAGDDYLRGGEVLQGGDGSDYLEGGYNAYGGAGHDIIRNDFADGGAGRDMWLLGLHPDLIFDRDGDKIVLDHQSLVTAFTGKRGEIILTPDGAEVDTNGDGVADWVYEARLSADDFISLAFHGGPVQAVNDTASGTSANEFFYGGGGDDNLSGGGGTDFVFGGFGNDVLNGNSGDDLLVGQANDDKLYGGSGDDELDGGDGNDTLSGSIGDDFAHGGAGDDLLAGGDGNDRLLGELGNDRLNGGAGDDELDGGEGDDSLAGEYGADHLLGGHGDDRLAGGAGNDTLEGGEGDDTLIGGTGKDMLTGGEGVDHFVFQIGDSRPGGGVRDVISDFTSGVDKLDLRALGVTDSGAQVVYQAIGSGLIVHVDLNGDGFDYSDFAVQLTGLSSLGAEDILF